MCCRFDKKLKFNNHISKKQSPCGKIKKWFSKWNKLLASFIVFIVFFVLLSLVVYNIKCEHIQGNLEKNYKNIEDVSKKESIRRQTQCMNNLEKIINLFKNQSGDNILVLESIRFIDKKIEKCWFKRVKLPIDALKIASCNFEDISRNADASFKNLQVLMLEDTEIRYVKRGSLLNTKLKQFSLINSFNNKNIEAKALKCMANTLIILNFKKCLMSEELIKDSFQWENLKYLDINRNLSRLQRGKFDFIRSSSIQIHNNDWKCDCDVLWFKQFFTKYRNNLFRNVEFLCDNTTTTTTTTIPPKPSNNSIWFNCKTSKINKHDLLYFSHKIALANDTIEFSFYQIDDKPKYIIEIDGNCNMNYLLWKNVNNRSDIGCIILSSKLLEINLQYEQTYTLCLLENQSDKVSPYDCTSLTVPPEWSSRTWLENNKQPLVISLLCLIILLTIIFSCLSMFYCIRQNPNLIKGNKRVIIVGNKTVDAIILPKTYARTKYIPPSLNSYSDGYLTPKPNYYKTNNCNNRPSLSTISEKSIESIYADIECVVNNGNCRINNKIEKNPIRCRTQLEHLNLVDIDHLYETPPLLTNHSTEPIYNYV